MLKDLEMKTFLLLCLAETSWRHETRAFILDSAPVTAVMTMQEQLHRRWWLHGDSSFDLCASGTSSFTNISSIITRKKATHPEERPSPALCTGRKWLLSNSLTSRVEWLSNTETWRHTGWNGCPSHGCPSGKLSDKYPVHVISRTVRVPRKHWLENFKSHYIHTIYSRFQHNTTSDSPSFMALSARHRLPLTQSRFDILYWLFLGYWRFNARLSCGYSCCKQLL